MDKHDLGAVSDLLSDLDEESDSLEIEAAAEMLDALKELMLSLRMSISLVETQLLNTLESPRAINGNLYEVLKSDGKWRPDHMPVDAAVRRASVADENGELREASDAVQEAIRLMADLYRAPSTMPKIGALEKLRLKKYQVAEQEPGKPVLKVTPIVESEPDVAHYEKSGNRLSATAVVMEPA